MRYVIALVALLALASTQGARQRDRAPDFTLRDLRNQAVRLSHLKGKVVLINFWATWCAPCKAEMPELIKWQKQYEDKGLRVIGVTYPPYRKSSVVKLAKELRINYRIAFGSKRIAKSYTVGEVLPVTIIVDTEGKIAGHVLGIMEQEEFDRKVKPLLE
jgi:thiol-disulfide isomerase/thioredoxin